MTSTSKDSDDEEEEDDDDDTTYDYDQSKASSLKSGKTFIKQKLNFLEAFLATEMWGILVSVLMQDGPFAIMRLISISAYRIVTYTNYFFTGKNVLVLALQIYRLISIYYESKEAKQKEEEQKRAIKIAKLYQGAFIEYQKRKKDNDNISDD